MVSALGATSPLAGKFVGPLHEKDKPLNEKRKSRGTLWAQSVGNIVVQLRFAIGFQGVSSDFFFAPALPLRGKFSGALEMKNTSASLGELCKERLSYVRISFARALPPPRLSAIAPSALAGTRARAPRKRASEATRRAQDIDAGVSSFCEGRTQEVVLFMALSS